MQHGGESWSSLPRCFVGITFLKRMAVERLTTTLWTRRIVVWPQNWKGAGKKPSLGSEDPMIATKLELSASAKPGKNSRNKVCATSHQSCGLGWVQRASVCRTGASCGTSFSDQNAYHFRVPRPASAPIFLSIPFGNNHEVAGSNSAQTTSTSYFEQ